MEIWAKIKGFDDYEVSNLGRIRSLDRFVKNGNGYRIVHGKILKLFIDKDGYQTVSLHKKTKNCNKKCHRLVAEAFLSNPENKPQINHINCTKTDNRASNLEWVTHSENILHSYKNGIMDNWMSKKRKAVRCSNGMVFSSSYAGAEYLNTFIFKGTKKICCIAGRIRRCAAGHQLIAYGFKWEYDSN
jgi:hypothetical protein